MATPRKVLQVLYLQMGNISVPAPFCKLVCAVEILPPNSYYVRQPEDDRIRGDIRSDFARLLTGLFSFLKVEKMNVTFVHNQT